jgi:hypothetical protein
MTVGEKIFRCWAGGLSIRSTMTAVRYTTGKAPTFEEVRRQFVMLSEKFG